MDDGSLLISTPVGAPIFVDGKYVGTVGAPEPKTGKLRITTNPVGARVYTKRLGGYIYAGLSPQTLTLPASAVPFLVKVTKDEYSDVHDLVPLLPDGTVEQTYAMERIAIEEPEETTTSLKVTSHPAAEVFLYMEGAEGFISYGRTPQMLTLKARTGAWVPMDEAKRALTETRLSAIEDERVRKEDAKRTALVEAAQEAYDDAKAERKDVEETLRGFRESYNLFQASFNVFFSDYTSFTTDYSSLQSEIRSLEREILELESMGSLESWEREYLNTCRSSLPSLKALLSRLGTAKDSFDTEKAEWDMDNLYWTDILLDYEQRRTVCLEYEERMKNELIEVKLRARAPFWLPTPGMKGVMWHLKLEEPGYRTVVDEFLLEPGRPVTKDYAIVKILDVTTPESLAPLIINTPRPQPPDSPFAFAWLYIISWPTSVKYGFKVTDVAANLRLCWPHGCQSYSFIKVKPGRRTYLIEGSRWDVMKPITRTLDIAPGETRYIQIDIIKPTEEERVELLGLMGGDWLGCPSKGRSEPTMTARQAQAIAFGGG